MQFPEVLEDSPFPDNIGILQAAGLAKVVWFHKNIDPIERGGDGSTMAAI